MSKLDALLPVIPTLDDDQLHALALATAFEMDRRNDGQGEELQADDFDTGSASSSKGGRGWIEEKMIPDSKTGKLYGPYRYKRWWDGKICRSEYLGKA